MGKGLPTLISSMITGLAARYNSLIILDNINQSCQDVKSWNLPWLMKETAWMNLGFLQYPHPAWAEARVKKEEHPHFAALCYQISLILPEVKQTMKGNYDVQPR